MTTNEVVKIQDNGIVWVWYFICNWGETLRYKKDKPLWIDKGNWDVSSTKYVHSKNNQSAWVN